MYFSELKHIIHAHFNIIADNKFNDLVVDSRNCINPESSLFIALKGKRTDGHKFINQLIKRGVKNFILSKYFEIPNELKVLNYALVEDTKDALQQLATWKRNRFNNPVIGITGSNGKTIVKEWIYQILQHKYTVLRSPKSYNSQIGVPLSVWPLNDIFSFAVFEAGISLPGEMDKLYSIIKPTIGIFTNLGDAHQENFKTLEEKLYEKARLFKDCKVILYSVDNELVESTFKNLYPKTKLLSWSLKKSADLQLIRFIEHESSTTLTAVFRNSEYTITLPFTDNASIENCMNTWLLMLYLNIPQQQIENGFTNIQPVSMRLEMIEGENNTSILNDSYNSDINSFIIALDALEKLNPDRKKIVILSDILQSSFQAEKLYMKIAKLIQLRKIEAFVGVGPNLCSFSNLFYGAPDTQFFQTTSDFKEWLKSNRISNCNILIKGSRKYRFEEITSMFQKKSHQTILEISFNALLNNLNYFKTYLRPRTKLMVMVKAFSYGSGLSEIASFMQNQGVSYLGVAIADEGVVLRKSGIDVPIMVMNPEKTSYKQITDYNLEPEIYNFKGLELFHQFILKEGMSNYPVHIKLDSGMNRLGIPGSSVDELIQKLKQYKNLTVKSVFSHLAGSDEGTHDEFTLHQIQLFEESSQAIKNALPYPVMRHILNSSGIERFPQYQFDMVRLGIGLYGISAIQHSDVWHISTFKTKIIQTKSISADATVGYGRKGRVNSDSVIGILPVGYADGLNRKLSNKNWSVEIHGQFAPIIGNICMDMCMVDITGIECSEGDEAIIFNDKHPVSEMAEVLGTIPYEVLTSVSQRVKRIYLRDYK